MTLQAVASRPNVQRASMIVMLSLLLSRVLGIAREMIINWKFGQSMHTDAYRLAFQIPDLIFFLVAGGALSSAFIPVFSEYLHTGREEDAWKVFSSVTTIMSLALLVVIGGAWLFAMPLAHIVAPGKAQEIYPLIAHMSRILLPAQFAFFIGGLMMGTLYSRQVFSIPSLGPNIYNLGIIFGALVFSSLVALPVSGMTWGALFGAFVGSMALPAWMMWKLGSKFRPTLDTKHPGVRKVFRLMAPVVLGLSLPSVFPMIMQYFGSPYGNLVNSAIANANQMMQAPQGIFGQSLALAAFPALSQYFAQDRMDLFRGQVNNSLRQVIYLSVPVSILLAVMPTPIIRALFQHGRFTAEDTERTSFLLSMFAIGIAGWCIQPMLMRSYFALQKTITPVVYGTITTALFVVACLGIRSAGLDYSYLPLAGSICAYVMVLLLLFGLNKTLGDIDFRALGITFAKSVLAGGVAMVFLWGAMHFAPQSGGTGARLLGIALLGVFLTGFGWIYYFVTKQMGMDESKIVARALNRGSKTPPNESDLPESP
ncbi:MAG: murein biosynthesis integral membrane protein MurJ [Armatimonadetes bacterium]|nr:murein biosynthesis integral membrane protein MurJ [Armatimonadota bacterium]